MESRVFWLLGMLIAACALRAYLDHDLLKDPLYAYGSLLLLLLQTRDIRVL